MAAITWRNVDAPDFRTSLAGLQTAGNMINSAFDSARRGLDDFRKIDDGRVNNAFQLELLKYADDAAMQAAFAADPTLGFDPRKLNQASLSAAGSRVSDLLSNASTRIQNDTGEFNLGEARDKRDRFVNASPDASKALAAWGSGDENKANEIIANSTALQSLRPGELAELMSSGQRLTEGDIGFDTSRLNNNVTAENQSWKRTDREEGRAGQALAMHILETEPTADGARAALTMGVGANASPMVKAAAAQVLNGQFPGLFGDISGPTGSGPGGVSGTLSDGSGDFGGIMDRLFAREGGFVASDGRSGAPANFGINQRANPDIDVKNLTKAQAQQIYKERYWDPIQKMNLPAYAKEAVFDFGVNAGVGKAKELWGKSGGDINKFNELRLKHYRSLPDYAQNGASWERRVAETTPSTDAMNIEAAAKTGQTKSTFSLGRYAETLGTEATAREAASALTAKGGAFEGRNVGDIASRLDAIVQRGKDKNGIQRINYADAADILARSRITDDDGSGGTWGIPGIFQIRTDQDFARRVDAEIAKAIGGDRQRAAANVADTQRTAAQLTQLEAAAARASQEYQMLQQRALTQPVSPETLAMAKAKRDAAVRNYNTARAENGERISSSSDREDGENILNKFRPRQRASFSDIMGDIFGGNLFSVRKKN